MSVKIMRFFIILTLVVLVLVVGAYIFIDQQIRPVDEGSEQVISLVIPNNSDTNQIANILYNENLINDVLIFRLYVKFEGLDKDLKAGNYNLSPSMSLAEIVNQLIKGQISLVTFTVPEGYRLEQVVNLLEKNSLIDKEIFWELLENGKFNFPWDEELPEGKERFEGFLFPDTYKIPENFSEKNIIQMMLNRFVEIFNEEYQRKLSEMDMSILELVTLASIIEREIRHSDEQPIASAVFHNRLEMDMRLESCATVQYALGEVKERLSYADLEINSPYNTYRVSGLPPGPIAAPGKGAIEAALFPSNDDYLYFLVKPDGYHHFSKTYAEHLRARDIYLR